MASHSGLPLLIPCVDRLPSLVYCRRFSNNCGLVTSMQTRDVAKASMCALVTLLLIGAAPDAMAQDTPNVRSAGRKLDLSELRAQPDTNQVVVKFREGEKVRVANQKLTGMRSGQANLLNNMLRQAGVTETALTPLFEAPPEELERDRSEGQRRSGRELADLSLYFVITLPPTASAAEVANNLNTLPFVEYARPALRPAPPPIYSIPKAADPLPEGDAARASSPNLTPWQTYKGKAPPGIGPIPNVKGSDGRGMSFADVEYDWTLTHEDLRISSLRALETELTPDRFGGPEHGTAVLGILSSLPNSFGVTGIAPGALAYVAAASSKELGYQPARAVGIAMNKLMAGDVIVIEQQAPVCGLEDYGPLEVLPGHVRRRLGGDRQGHRRRGGGRQWRRQSRPRHVLWSLRSQQAQLASHYRRRRLIDRPEHAELLQLRLARRRAGLGRERRHHRLWRCL